MRPNHFVPMLLLAVLLAACTPQTVVTVPTLAVLPSATPEPITAVPQVASVPAEPPTATLTPSATPTTSATPTPEATIPISTNVASPTGVASDIPAATLMPPTVTLTPSLTITMTLTLTPSPTLTPTADVGGFSALVDLAGRVTIPPPDVRYGAATATALWAIGDQLAATARAGATAVPTTGPVSTGVLAVVPGATLPQTGLGTLPPPPGNGGAVCSGAPGGALGGLLASDLALASQIGCATGSPTFVAGAFQPFERGLMIYRAPATPGQQGTIESLTNDGRFARSPDTWVSGVDPDSGGQTPPPGLVEPIRGFGKVWRSDPALAAQLGWALAGEQGVTLTVQPFERGIAVYAPTLNLIYVLAEDSPGAPAGNWRSVSGGL